MTATHFVDSNLLVYARDASEPAKRPLAQEWLSYLWNTRAGRLSTQVLNEFYVTITCKLKPGLSPEEAWKDVESFLAWQPLAVDGGVLQRGRRVQDRFGFSWWDSLVVAAAQTTRSTYLLTEDLQDGQDLNGLRVVNPFNHRPAELVEPTAPESRIRGRIVGDMNGADEDLRDHMEWPGKTPAVGDEE